jgi:hypothetical protein
MNDLINSPGHYTSHPSGVECLDITKHMNFCLGNAIKYIWRSDLKGSSVADLYKAMFYIQQEIYLREGSKRTPVINEGEFVYLGGPYSSDHDTTVKLRVEILKEAAAFLFSQNLHVYSPIEHCHGIATKYNLPTDADFWWNYNKCFLSRASGFYYLPAEGWEHSKGLQQEIAYAKKINMPIHEIDFDEMSEWAKGQIQHPQIGGM